MNFHTFFARDNWLLKKILLIFLFTFLELALEVSQMVFNWLTYGFAGIERVVLVHTPVDVASVSERCRLSWLGVLLFWIFVKFAGGTHRSFLIPSEFCLSLILLNFLLFLNSLFSCKEIFPKLFVILILFEIVFFPVLELLLFLLIFILKSVDLTGNLFPSFVVALLNFLLFFKKLFATYILILQMLNNVLLFYMHHFLNLFFLLFQFRWVSYSRIIIGQRFLLSTWCVVGRH